MEQKVLRVSTWVIVCALLLRLLSGGEFGTVLGRIITPEAASWMLFLQTGRLIRPTQISFTPEPTEPPPETTPLPAVTEPQTVLTFAPEAAEAIDINCSFQYSANLAELVSQPLDWDLTGDKPTVLILHSHATESFAPTGEYLSSAAYRTQDTAQNMVSVGAYVAELLEAGGISVLHDRTLHDSPSYDAAYTNSRATAQSYLEAFPSIKLVLDLHRDYYEDENGNQIVRTVFSQGQTLAPLMFVVGTDYGGYTHPNWQENLALALKLQTQIEELCPGICRSVNLRSQRFNQDLSTGALLVEVGASSNTHEQALLSAELLAEAILSLAHGSR